MVGCIEQEVRCEFIRINPDKEVFDIFEAINKIVDLSNNHLIHSLINQLKKL